MTAEEDRVQAETGQRKGRGCQSAGRNRSCERGKGRVSAESDRVTAEQERQKQAQEVLDKANEAVKIAGQINEASYMLDKDANIKYAYAIYTERGIPHLVLTLINE